MAMCVAHCCRFDWHFGGRVIHVIGCKICWICHTCRCHILRYRFLVAIHLTLFVRRVARQWLYVKRLDSPFFIVAACGGFGAWLLILSVCVCIEWIQCHAKRLMSSSISAVWAMGKQCGWTKDCQYIVLVCRNGKRASTDFRFAWPIGRVVIMEGGLGNINAFAVWMT